MDIQDYTLETDTGPFRLTGRLLGSGSTHREGKDRWFEVGIYVRTDGKFVLHTVGRSTLPNETPRCRLIITGSSYEVAERLIVSHGGRVYVPGQSLRALTSAAQWDDDMLEALEALPTMIAARRAGEPHRIAS